MTRNTTSAHLLVYMLFLALFAGTGCRKTETVQADDPLLDPAVQPKVVFTYPKDGAVGPFNLFAPKLNACVPVGNDGCLQPGHFFIQFNKLMAVGALGSHTVHVAGFDNPVKASVRNSGGERLASTFEFVLTRNSSDTYSGDVAVFEVGKTYSVTVDTGVCDATGNTTKAPFTFSFTPEPYFRVLEMRPSKGESVPISASPQILFNSIVDTSVLQGITFSPPIPGHWYFQEYDGVHWLQFQKNGQLKEATEYTLVVSDGVHDKAGHPIGSNSGNTVFNTYQFRVDFAEPATGRQTFDLQTIPVIYFTAPVNIASIVSAITTYPSELSAQVSGNAIRFAINGHELRPSTKYDISIGTTLESEGHNHLKEPFTYSFRSPAFTITYSYPSANYPVMSRTSSFSFDFTGALDTLTVPLAFSIDPPVKGRFKYYGNIGVTDFAFVPDTFLTYNKMYRTIISTSLRSIDGYPFEKADTLDIAVDR